MRAASTNSEASLAFNDLKTNSTEAGILYNSPLGNQASLFARRTDGRYPNLPSPIGNSFQQDDIQAAVQWKPGVKSAVNLQFGHTRREQANLPQRDFSGTTGRMTIDWAPTGVTSINATMGREVTPITAISVQNFNLANFAVVRSYGIGVRWTPTTKVSADAKLSRQSREFGAVPADTTTASSLALRYMPISAIQILLQFNHEARRSDNPALVLPYTSNVGVLSLSFSF
jgi:Putative beta-barrel porin 2